VEFEQDHGGCLQIHRGYLGLGNDQLDPYPDRISDTCQNLSGMTPQWAKPRNQPPTVIRGKGDVAIRSSNFLADSSSLAR